jgi:hypothetical protein
MTKLLPVTLALLLAASPAFAEPAEPVADADPVLLRNTLGFTAAVAGAAAGGLVGFFAGFAVTGCHPDPRWGCSDAAIIFGTVVVGAAVASAGGMWGVGELLSGRGSFWWMLLGAVVGTGAGFLVAPLVPPRLDLALLVLPAAGATLANHLSDRAERLRTAGATVSVGPGSLVVRF